MCAILCDDRLRGLGVARGRISCFPIDLRRRPYNTPHYRASVLLLFDLLHERKLIVKNETSCNFRYILFYSLAFLHRYK